MGGCGDVRNDTTNKPSDRGRQGDQHRATSIGLDGSARSPRHRGQGSHFYPQLLPTASTVDNLPEIEHLFHIRVVRRSRGCSPYGVSLDPSWLDGLYNKDQPPEVTLTLIRKEPVNAELVS